MGGILKKKKKLLLFSFVSKVLSFLSPRMSSTRRRPQVKYSAFQIIHSLFFVKILRRGTILRHLKCTGGGWIWSASWISKLLIASLWLFSQRRIWTVLFGLSSLIANHFVDRYNGVLTNYHCFFCFLPAGDSSLLAKTNGDVRWLHFESTNETETFLPRDDQKPEWNKTEKKGLRRRKLTGKSGVPIQYLK